MSDIKSGDVVRFRGGGPLMTVNAENGDVVDVVWFVGDDFHSASCINKKSLYRPEMEASRHVVPHPVDALSVLGVCLAHDLPDYAAWFRAFPDLAPTVDEGIAKVIDAAPMTASEVQRRRASR